MVSDAHRFVDADTVARLPEDGGPQTSRPVAVVAASVAPRSSPARVAHARVVLGALAVVRTGRPPIACAPWRTHEERLEYNRVLSFEAANRRVDFYSDPLGDTAACRHAPPVVRGVRLSSYPRRHILNTLTIIEVADNEVDATVWVVERVVVYYARFDWVNDAHLH